MSDPIVSQPVTTEQSRHIPVEGLWLAEYMPLDRAVYILDDMTTGQLIAFWPRNRVVVDGLSDPSVELTAAALTLYWAIEMKGFIGWTDDAITAMWAIFHELGELAEHDPLSINFVFAQLTHYPLGETVQQPRVISPAPEFVPVTKAPRAGYVYILRSPTGAYKIGYAANPADRLRTFTVKLPFEVEYELLIKTDNMRGLEAELHEYYSEKHINGEWFALTDDDLAELRQLSGAQ